MTKKSSISGKGSGHKRKAKKEAGGSGGWRVNTTHRAFQVLGSIDNLITAIRDVEQRSSQEKVTGYQRLSL